MNLATEDGNTNKEDFANYNASDDATKQRSTEKYKYNREFLNDKMIQESQQKAFKDDLNDAKLQNADDYDIVDAFQIMCEDGNYGKDNVDFGKVPPLSTPEHSLR